MKDKLLRDRGKGSGCTGNQVRGCAFWVQDVNPSEESWPKPTSKGVWPKRTTLRVSAPERGSGARNSGTGVNGPWEATEEIPPMPK